ncbi:uncharacterized protein LOC113235304 [Hyposmocoma kahamanoa]|uniref:uncharacterized protein LOC113235304 n=1 Tax=Hyposmocoma kahamanoa TaxID=1477025 RepID=UPI000E6D6CDA|nr:uncharacterized protein LOC113235304 [Hyposmocoma kahamanoa]
MDFKKWSSRGENKEKMENRKRQIQEDFKKEKGLLVDIVKQGAGTTNDGNTARRFFSDAKTSARITGVDEELIERFHIILQTVASGERIDLTKFSEFCKNTATLYVQLYPWYYMPSSVHKLLMHGADIIEYFGMLPIGNLSEEASEARNKDFRKYRENHSRKVSRTATNEDILHNLLLSSDPKLTSLRPRMAKHQKMVLSPRAVELLMSFPNEPELDFIDINNLQDSDSD